METLFEKKRDFETLISELVEKIQKIEDVHEKIETLNFVRARLHEVSPMKSQPVDFVQWVKSDTVVSNDYNPNTVAPPEMRLLEISIDHDGFTMPIVTMQEGDKNRVIDGFHRRRVGTESKKISNRLFGYLPVSKANPQNNDTKDLMAATIRHNRARGKHGVEPMSDIVRKLFIAGWSDVEIAKELGMDGDEVLRLRQFAGIADSYTNRSFGRSWEVEDGQVS